MSARIPGRFFSLRRALLLAGLALPSGVWAQGVRISAPLPPGGQVLQSLFAPDGRHVLYVARGYEPASTSTLFSVDLEAGPQRVQQLSHALWVAGRSPEDPGVRDDLRITADSQRVVYRAQQDTLAQFELYSALLDGSQPALRISVPLGINERLWDFQLSPDGARAVYGVGTSGIQSLHAVPLDGSGADVLLASAYGPGILDVRFTPDDEVVFRAYTGQYALYRAKLDGSQPAVPLFVNGSNSIAGFELSPDGVWAVCRATVLYSIGFHLFAVRVDGSQPPIDLSGPLIPGANVEEFHVNSLSTRVVYRADQDLDDVFDLYSVPIDGSAGLTGLELQPPFSDVQPDFQLSHDGLGVVYRADAETDEVFELYVASLDGSFAPVKRSGPLTAGGSVRDFQLGPLDKRLLYRADQDTNETFELYSASILGSGAPVKLNGPLNAFSDVLLGYRISADASHVVFLSDPSVNESFELFEAPMDGATSAKRVSGSMVPGGGVKSFELSPDGTRATYLADQDVDDQIELYLGKVVPVRDTSRTSPPGTTVVRGL